MDFTQSRLASLREISLNSRMRKTYFIHVILLLTLLLCNRLHAQDKNLVFVDKEGVLRWTSNKKEAAFFAYPGFLPLWFRSGASGPLNLVQLEKMQIICHGEGKQTDLEIAAVWLEK